MSLLSLRTGKKKKKVSDGSSSSSSKKKSNKDVDGVIASSTETDGKQSAGDASPPVNGCNGTGHDSPSPPPEQSTAAAAASAPRRSAAIIEEEEDDVPDLPVYDDQSAAYGVRRKMSRGKSNGRRAAHLTDARFSILLRQISLYEHSRPFYSIVFDRTVSITCSNA